MQVLDPNKKGREADALEARLRQLVIGQDEATAKIVGAYQAFRTLVSPAGRPVANFLFLGPTGSGKTRVVEATPKPFLKILVRWSKSIARNSSTATRLRN